MTCKRSCRSWTIADGTHAAAVVVGIVAGLGQCVVYWLVGIVSCGNDG